MRSGSYAFIVAATAIASVAATIGATSTARADCVQGGPVTRDCRLDLFVGPVLMSNRVTALGGAYSGIAEGTEGDSVNAASPAVRDPWSLDWFGLDLDVGITLPTIFHTIDFENEGPLGKAVKFNNFVEVDLGLNMQVGAWGLGFTTALQTYYLTPTVATGQPSFNAALSKSHVLIARQFLHGDFVVGLGLRVVGLNVDRQDANTGASSTLASLFGVGPELGVSIRPAAWPLRIGATVRAPVTGTPSPNGSDVVNGMTIPGGASLPWEIDVGVGLEFGPRPLNIPWHNPHDDDADLRDAISRAREARMELREWTLAATPESQRAARKKELDDDESRTRAAEDLELQQLHDEARTLRGRQERVLPRNRLLATASVLISGPTGNGISLTSFLAQCPATVGTNCGASTDAVGVVRSGRFTTVSPRGGVESEIIPRFMRGRVGSYVEPSRVSTTIDPTDFRLHGTAGFDIYLFRWSVFGLFNDDAGWQITGMVDVAKGYTNYGVSIGRWKF